jgi:multidrug efflux system outer membrane protein
MEQTVRTVALVRIDKAAALAPLALLGACSFAPAYKPPLTATPPVYKETAVPMPAGWAAATPMDTVHRGQWWLAFNDPVLNDLEARAEAASPTLAAALARYDQARATARSDQADLFPTAGVEGDIVRERSSATAPGVTASKTHPFNDRFIGGSLSYEIDLWGRIRNTIAASKAEANASGSDLTSARLSLQAAVADAYAQLRGLDAQAELLTRTVAAFQRAYQLTSDRHDGGVGTGLDVNRARTTLSNAKAQVSAIANQRAAIEHQLAALTGAVASSFTVDARVQPLQAPDVPTGMPSELLQRRPDIAAAERRMFEANARIGVAKAAFFPKLTVGLSGGWESTTPDLFSTPNTFWGLGPLTSVLTLFDGGKRAAQVRLSRAQYDEMAADYRNTVLTAFQQVEDNIAAMHHLADQTLSQRDAAEAAQRTSDLALTRYRDGASDYLEVVTAQTDALSSEQALLTVEVDRMRASIALVKALGGAA